MFFGWCSCGSGASASDDVIRTNDRIVRKKEETEPKKRDSLSSVMAKRSVASKRESRFDSADFFLEQKGEVPTRKPPAKPSLEDIVGEKNNQEEKEEEKKNNNNQQDQKSLAKTITEHLKSTEYLEWAEPDSPDKRKDLVGKKQRRGTLEALQDLGVSFNGDDSFSGPKTSRVREEEEKKKKKSSSRWTFFKRKKDS